jgi:hypothetical protein
MKQIEKELSACVEYKCVLGQVSHDSLSGAQYLFITGVFLPA